MLALYLFVLSTYCLQKICCDRLIISKDGPIQGITVQSDGTYLEAYLGIPYAEPPVRRLRFAKPVPKTSWVGVFDASRLPPPCIQNVTKNMYYEPDVTNMTEDCLYLNIWVPYFKQKSLLRPVLVFIHGGAYNQGSSNQKVYDGARLAVRGEVVVVTINYRVGALGFFSAFTPDADGNMGLFDQALAIKWVKDNAISFSGNPEHIVLIGQSAGAMSAAGHMLSPLTKHMIKRVILQSGAAMLPFISDDNERLHTMSRRLATLVGCADKTVTIENNPRSVVNCLKNLPAEKIAQAEGIIISSSPITFTPRTGDAILPDDNIELIRNGSFSDTEMLIGVTRNEGSFFLTAAVPQYFGIYGKDGVQSLSKTTAMQFTRMAQKMLGATDEKEIANF